MLRNCGYRSIGMLLFLTIFLACGIFMIVYGWRILSNASISTNWPSVSGQITQSRIRVEHDEDGTTYYADVVFEYVAADKRYTGDTVNFGEYGSSNENHAAEIVSRYPVGREVLVTYDPDDPATAVLEPGVTLSSYMVLGIGVLFTLIPFLVLFLSLGKQRRF